jgi:hypothetical protein
MRTNLINKEEGAATVEEGLLDLVIAFDTTGSMASFIGDVKKHVTDLVPELLRANPKMMIGIVAFGDYCDMLDVGIFGNAYQCLNLSNKEEEIISFIEQAEKTFGGDGDEFYELVIRKITNETNWREGSNKVVLLIGDAAPHSVNYKYIKRGKTIECNIDWRIEAECAKTKGIKFDTLGIWDYESWYKELSEITGGVYSLFNAAEKTNRVMRAVAYARGGVATASLFKQIMEEDKDDTDLTHVYSMYSEEVIN